MILTDDRNEPARLPRVHNLGSYFDALTGVRRDPLAAIDAHPRCRVAASGSHLDAEQVSDQ